MPEYVITFAKSARKDLERLPPQISERVLDRIERLSAQPRPPGSIKLRDESGLWRIRIGNYRVIYSIDDKKEVVDVSLVRHRKDVYRDL
jgi:mRNA interferase RelE/StbE